MYKNTANKNVNRSKQTFTEQKMRNKKLQFSNIARASLLKGVNTLADAVVSTLGPFGRNVIIEQENEANPVSTKDGVTVAKSIKVENPEENLGIQIVRQASIKTADQAGDGTTTSTLLAREIYKKALESISKDTNTVEIKRGVDKAVTEVVKYLKKYSIQVKDENQLKQVATISGNNDEEIGNLINLAVKEVGADGLITIEESKSWETYHVTVEGIQLDRGYKSHYFVTDQGTMQAVLNDPLILITDKRLVNVKELLPVLQHCSSQNKHLLIIAEDIDQEALSVLIVNKVRGTLNCAAIKAPEFGDRKKYLLEDIAILTGGQVVTKDRGMVLEKFDTTWFGSASKVVVGKDYTNIIDVKGDQEAIDKRVEELKMHVDSAESPFEKENAQKRLARFSGGVSVIHVGGYTEVEMKEKKDRVEDALHATKAALQEGILPGGGLALLQASKSLVEAKKGLKNNSQELGWNIVMSAIQEPFKTILRNAGYDPHEIDTIEKNSTEKKWVGFDLRNVKYVNMLKAGIIDPTKVTRLALENAASVAGTLLTTEAIVVNTPEEIKNTSEVDPSMLMG